MQPPPQGLSANTFAGTGSGPPAQGVRPGLAESLLALFLESSPLQLSFHDFYGMCQEIPELRLRGALLQHQCSLCQFAKAHADTHGECVSNKLSVNRLVLRRKQGLSGMCHLGLTDIVEPVIVEGRVVGVLYYGSVTIKGGWAASVRKIKKYCERKGTDPAPFIQRLAAANKVSRQEIQVHKNRLKHLAQVFAAIISLLSPPAIRQKPLRAVGRMRLAPAPSFLVEKAMQYLDQHYREPVTRESLASFLHCHPNHLSREFNRHAGCSISAYIHRVRISHSKLLLATRQYTSAGVAYEVGFSDQSHFHRVFKAQIGMTPTAFARKVVTGT